MKPKEKEAVLQETGKYLIDISKLVFGGIILAGVMEQSINQWWLFGVGGLSAVLALAAGLVLTAITNKGD